MTNTRPWLSTAAAALAVISVACSGASNSLTSPSSDVTAVAAGGTNRGNPGGEEPPTGLEGCTPGYWKGNVKAGGLEWKAAGLVYLDKVSSLGIHAGDYGGLTLLEALELGGGPGVAGATQNLLRAAIAAYLNAKNAGVAYPWNAADVVNAVNGALYSKDRETILDLASKLDAFNNLGCPLDNSR